MTPVIMVPFVLENGEWQEDNVSLTNSHDLTPLAVVEVITDPTKATVVYNGEKREVTLHARDGYGWVREGDLE